MNQQSDEPRPAHLRNAIKARSWGIVLTYTLTLIENTFALLYPFATGLAIDDLLGGQGWRSLVPLVAIWLAHIVSGTAHQLYDTRLFTRIYSAAAGSMIEVQRAAAVSTSGVSARAEMTEEVIEFFEYQIPLLIQALIGVVGAAIMLLFYDSVAGLITIALFVPVALLQYRYGRRALALGTHLNDQRERQVDTIADGRRHRIALHFRALRRWRVMMSDANAWCWSITDLLSLVAVVLVLLRITGRPDVQAGDVFAALAYALAVAAALEETPDIVERFVLLVDGLRRVDSPEDR